MRNQNLFNALHDLGVIAFESEIDSILEAVRKDQAETLQGRSDIMTILEKYSKFLEENGYTDTDWRTEEPYAIDEFMKTL